MTNLSHCFEEVVKDTAKNKVKQQKQYESQIYHVLEQLKGIEEGNEDEEKLIGKSG